MKIITLKLIFTAIIINLFNSIFESVKVAKPPNIKTIIFKINNNSSQFPILKKDSFIELSFDDLNASEDDYYYKISYYNYDWSDSILFKNEFIEGLDNIRVSNYENSFNTLQRYTHYKLTLPNSSTDFKLSGNYKIHIYNSNDELQFSRRFVYLNPIISVSANVFRTRNLNYFQTHQNIKFNLTQNDLGLIQGLEDNLNIIIIQNNQWSNSISGIQPQFKNNKVLKYRYDIKTSFEGGNEYLFFDTKDLRITGPNVSFINLGVLYESYLYTDIPRKKFPYSFNQDINGGFQIRTVIGSQNAEIEADYSWVYFTLAASIELPETDLFILSDFNNYEPNRDNLMSYNKTLDVYEAKILIKQGFYNYKYFANTVSGWKPNLVSGNFFQTENSYKILVYYKAPGEIFDELIGIGETDSKQILN
ncbi:MAG: hypothetical protein ACI914_001363 [Candidatus Marivariicella framensis]|jgi:hypothetical protein